MADAASKRSVLVTGGAGYIGSHTVVELQAAGLDVVVVDDLSNSHEDALLRVAEITGRPVPFVRGDVGDPVLLDDVFQRFKIDSVIHFAAKKAVGESVKEPLLYYRNNVAATITLIEAMAKHDCRRMVFSSSCTVYGQPETVPVDEDSPRTAASPYGRTKLMMEDILVDTAVADPRWQTILLRYFNPVGAHESGLIGEDPQGIPENLLPYVMQVAVGRLERLSVYGDDYPTRDGTAIRDYIHVVDLAAGHVRALEALERTTGCVAYNLGTGVGSTVLEVLAAAREATGCEIPHHIAPRRPGDVTEVWASPQRANEALGWSATRDLLEMCRDHWRWQQKNPGGYG